jgi:hypothetical protein
VGFLDTVLINLDRPASFFGRATLLEGLQFGDEDSSAVLDHLEVWSRLIAATRKFVELDTADVG